MMDKLISQQAAIDALCKSECGCNNAECRHKDDADFCVTCDNVKIIKSLPPVQPEPEAVFEWKREFKEHIESLDITRDEWKGIIEYIDELPSIQPNTTTHDSIPAETGKNDVDGTSGDCISRQQAIDKFIDELEEIFSDIREREVDDSVCGLCEYDGAYIGQSGDWCNECPGFDRDDCFKLSDKIRKEWTDEIIKALPSIQPERKRGKWIERESDTEDKENGFKTVIVCSCCDFPATTFYSEDCESRTQIRTDFCPNCGAKMEKR